MTRAAATVFVITATILQLLRQSGPSPLRSVFAEDAGVYVRDARTLSVVHGIFQPYNGYLQLLPRLIALSSRWIPLRDAGWVFAIGPALVISLLALGVFYASRGVIHQWWLRAGLASSFVFLPVAWWETLNFTANVIWYVIPAGFWMLIWRPSRRGGQVIGCLVGFFVIPSTLLGVVLLPLAVARLVLLPRGRDWAIPLAVVAGAILQGLAVILGPPRPDVFTKPGLGQLAESYLTRGYLLLPGEAIATHAFRALGFAATILAIAVVVAALAGEFRRMRQSILAITAMAMGTALLAGSEYLSWLPSMAPAGSDPGVNTSSRYAVPTALLTISALGIAAAQLPASWWHPRGLYRGGRVNLLSGLAICMTGAALVAGSVVDFRGFPARAQFFQDWGVGVARAQSRCEAGAYSVLLSGTPASFSPYLPCRELSP